MKEKYVETSHFKAIQKETLLDVLGENEEIVLMCDY